MSLYRKLFIPAILFLLCLPLASFASYRIKKAGPATAENCYGIVPVLSEGNAGMQQNTGKIHHTTFTGRLIRRIGNILLSHDPSDEETVVIALAFINLFLGLGIPRFYLGYIPEGIMQLVGVVLGTSLALLFFLFAAWGAFIFIVPAILFAAIAIGCWLWQFVDFVRICTGELGPEHRGRGRIYRD